LQLEAHGYDVTVTELVGWEHSMKNELIVASKILPSQGASQGFTHVPKQAKLSAQKLQAVLEQVGLNEMRTRFFTPLLHAASNPAANSAFAAK
jgi:hypothetical protein